MVSRGMTNTRVKDLWDIACLARRFAFDGETLRTAIEETLQRRQTPLADERPVALMPGYYLDATRAQRWQVLQGQIGASADGPALLVDAGEELLALLGAGMRQPHRRRPVHAGLVSRGALAAGNWGTRGRRRIVTDETGRLGLHPLRRSPPLR